MSGLNNGLYIFMAARVNDAVRDTLVRAVTEVPKLLASVAVAVAQSFETIKANSDIASFNVAEEVLVFDRLRKRLGRWL
jgi:hypothetical protein